MSSKPVGVRDFGPAGAALSAAAALAIGLLMALLVFWDGRDDLRLQISLLGAQPLLVDDLPYVLTSLVVFLLLLVSAFFAWVLKCGGLERPALGVFALAMVADAIPGLSQLAIALLLIVLIRRIYRDGDVGAPLTPLAIPVLLVIVSYATTLLLTDQWMAIMPTFLFRLSGNVLPVVLLPVVIRTRRHIEIFFHMLLVCACVSVAVEWLQWGLSAVAGAAVTFNPDPKSSVQMTPWGWFPQLTGLMYHPNLQSNCISTVAVLALWFGLRPARTITPGRRLLYLGAFVWLSLGVLFTWSRSGWLALGVATMLLPILRYPRLAPAYVTVCMILAGIAYETGLLKAGYEFAKDLDSSSADFRWRIASLALDAFHEHPWFGIGTMGILDYANPWKLQVHDTYLQVVAEMGVFGMIAFGSFGIMVLARLLWTLFTSKFEFDKEWVIGFMVASLVSLIQNSFVMFLWVHFLWLLIPLAECIHLAARDQTGRDPEDLPFLPPARPLAGGAA